MYTFMFKYCIDLLVSSGTRARDIKCWEPSESPKCLLSAEYEKLNIIVQLGKKNDLRFWLFQENYKERRET